MQNVKICSQILHLGVFIDLGVGLDEKLKGWEKNKAQKKGEKLHTNN